MRATMPATRRLLTPSQQRHSQPNLSDRNYTKAALRLMVRRACPNQNESQWHMLAAASALVTSDLQLPLF